MSPGNKIHPLEDISGVAWNRQVHVRGRLCLGRTCTCIGDFELSQLSCLSSSVGRASHLECVRRGFESHLSAAFFLETVVSGLVLCCVLLLGLSVSPFLSERLSIHVHVHVYYIHTVYACILHFSGSHRW